MKTPFFPPGGGLADGQGIEPRKKRDEELRVPDTKSCAPEHTLNGCNGTETLASIERALLRLTDGTFGTCVSCGADISLSRLEKNPAVETCATCQDTAPFKAH
jgi:DnaK suppressor protein